MNMTKRTSYTYAENNPVTFSDPSGHAAKSGGLSSLQNNIRIANGGNGPALKPAVNNPTAAAKAAYQSRRDALGLPKENTLLDNMRIYNGQDHYNDFVARCDMQQISGTFSGLTYAQSMCAILEARRCLGYTPCLNLEQWLIYDSQFNTTKVYAEQLVGWNQIMGVEMQLANAEYLYFRLRDRGWTHEAALAALANSNQESHFNPGQCQSTLEGVIDKSDLGNGYGIFQWDTELKFMEWAGLTKQEANDMANSSPRQLMDMQIEFLIASSTGKGLKEHQEIQWNNSDYNYQMPFDEFINSDKPVEEMAMSFLDSYERTTNHVTERQFYAGVWKEHIENNKDIEEDLLLGPPENYKPPVFYPKK